VVSARSVERPMVHDRRQCRHQRRRRVLREVRGVTRDYVLGMEAVIGRGEVVRLGRRTAKGVAGYDLAG
jgi:hypothetical protein